MTIIKGVAGKQSWIQIVRDFFQLKSWWIQNDTAANEKESNLFVSLEKEVY